MRKLRTLACILAFATATASMSFAADDDAKEKKDRPAQRAEAKKQRQEKAKHAGKAKSGGEQARPTRQQVFARYDKNKNGALDENERDALRADFAAKKHPVLAKLDINQDGKLEDKEINMLKGRAREEAKDPAGETAKERRKRKQQ